MKKEFAVIFILLVSCALVFSQGKTEQPSSQHAVTSSVIWTDSPSLQNGITEAVKAFSQENPQYSFTVEAFPGGERPQKLAFAKEGGTLPSLFLTGYFTSTDEIHQGNIIPVTDIAKNYYTDISQETFDQVRIQNDYYMIPVFTSPQGLLYNADMFRAAGLGKYVPDDPKAIATWTLNQMDGEILPKLKQFFAGTEKYVMTMYSANEQNDSYLHNLLKLYDGDIFKNGFVVAADDARTVNALAKVKEWIDKGYTNTDVTTRLWTECNADFRNQLCAISAGQFQSYLNHLAAFKSGAAKAFDVRIATVPVKKADGTDSSSMHVYTYGWILMNVDRNQQEAATEFLKWLSVHQEYTKSMINGVPASSTLIAELKTENPLYESYQNAEKFFFDFTGKAPGWVATRSKFYPEIQSAFSGNKTPKAALSDYQSNANKIIKEYSERSLVLNK